MATLVNDKDIALQASPYRNKTTLVAVTSTVSNFTVAKNGGPISPASTVVTAAPNIVFTSAATYTWDYSLNTDSTSWRGFIGGLIPGTTTFTNSGVSIIGIGTYNNVTGTSITGTGSGAIFNISKGVTGTTYGNIAITVVNGGTGYQLNDQIRIPGTSLGSVVGSLLSTTTLSRSGSAASAAINVTGVSGTTNGSGTGATFTIVKAAGQTNYSSATITIVNPGSGYALNNTITILGSSLGAGHGNLTVTITSSPTIATTNDLILTVKGQVFSLIGATQTITSGTIKSIIGTSTATSITFRCTVTEPLLETAYGQVVVAYTQEQANSDSINIDLSKVASTVSLSASGAGLYTGTGTTITVTRAGNGLLYDINGGSTVATATPNSFKVEIVQDSAVDITVPLRTLGTFSNTLNSFIFDGIVSLISDYATVTFRVIVYDASGNKTQTTYKQIQYSRVASGLAGADAVINYLDISAPVLVKSSASPTDVGNFVQITIGGKRTVGGVTSDYGYITVTGSDGNGSDAEDAVALNVSTGPFTTNILNSSTKTKYTVRLYSAAARTANTTVLLDSQVIPVVFTGGNAIIGSLSNDNTTIPLSPGNLVPTGGYNNTATFIRVFDGATELTYRTGTSTILNSSWVIIAITSSSGVTRGTISAVNKSAYLSQLLGIDSNNGTIQFDIEGINGAGKPFTLTLIQNIAKTFPGIDATLSYLDIPTPILSKNSSDISTDGAFTNITIAGKSTTGNGTPTNSGYITASPKVKVNSFLSNNGIYCTGVSAFTVNDPIVFTGIGLPSNITAGTEYFIKTINLIDKLITISATAPSGIAGTVITFTNGSLQALTNGISSTTAWTVSGTALSSTFTAKTNIGQKSTTGSGTGATFTITKPGSGTLYSSTTNVVIVNSGSKYSIGDNIVIDGAALGGVTGANDLTLTLIGTASLQKIGLTQVYAYSEKITATSISLTTNVPNDAGIYSLVAKMYSVANRYSVSSLDNQEILVLYKGSNAVTAILDNDSVAIPFNTALNGSIASATGAYDKSGTSISLYEGTTELTYDGYGVNSGTYKVVAAGIGITPGAISNVGIKAAIGSASGLSAPTASITFTITGKTTGGAAIPTITKTQTFSRNASGQPGAAGITYKIQLLTAFAWTNTGSPPALTGTFNYTWATGVLTNSAGTQTTGDIGYPVGWTSVAAAAPGNGYTLYQVTLTITDASTATLTSGISWSGAKVGRLGYRQDGSIGFTGDSARVGYTKQTLTTGNTVSTMAAPAAPTAVPGTSGGYTWQTTPVTTVAGEIMYQSDGFYSDVTKQTTWSQPYLSTFKVAQLSAITADLGYINAGSMSIGPAGEPARFTVSTAGAVMIKGAGTAYMQITNDAIKVFDVSGLRLQMGNLDA